MGIRITTNRVHITTEITQNDVRELDKIENLKYIQIGNYINNESLELIDEYITDRNQDIQFRIFGFDKTICNLKFLEYIKHIKNISIDTLKSVEGLDYLGMLAGLEKLNISVLDLDNIQFLNKISLNLKNLGISTASSKQQINLSILKRFPNLESLFLYNIKDDLKKIIDLKNLHKLTINGINLPDLTNINETNIRDLSIGYINDCNLDHLSGNKKLNVLELNKITKIDNIEILKELPKLSYVKLNQLGQIERLPSLMNNKMIEHIVLDNMRSLKDVSELELAPNLKYIEMYQMKLLEVDDIASVLSNKNLINAKCFTGGIKKDRVIKALIKEKNLDF